MLPELEPLRADRLKDVFISKFESLILSGELSIGQRLPPERELALQLGVSRPVVHEGLLELAQRGLVEIRARQGTFVCDYRQQGSLAALNSLVHYREGWLEPGLLLGLLELRRLFETEIARQAALRRGSGELSRLREMCAREQAPDARSPAGLADLDFAFHHALALASGNPIYPMLTKSFEPAYLNQTRRFFSQAGSAVQAFAFHRELVVAVEARDADRAAAAMARLLAHGEAVLKQTLGLADERPAP
jgi:GntR family transcriptional regulator, transcriptional repressor for pyruvate dehydrogenase complex